MIWKSRHCHEMNWSYLSEYTFCGIIYYVKAFIFYFYMLLLPFFSVPLFHILNSFCGGHQSVYLWNDCGAAKSTAEWAMWRLCCILCQTLSIESHWSKFASMHCICTFLSKQGYPMYTSLYKWYVEMRFLKYYTHITVACWDWKLHFFFMENVDCWTEHLLHVEHVLAKMNIPGTW